MSESAPSPNLKQPLSLAPADTPQGAMERNFLLETGGPQALNYDAGTDLEQMRDMRQVIENRLQNPADYAAGGAKTEIDILNAPGQFADFGNYPQLPKSKQQNITDDLKYADDPYNKQQVAYAQHVQNAITAATESIVPIVAGFPNATSWRQNGHKSPGANFYRLGEVGGNTFYATLPHLTDAAKPNPNALEGKSALERLRYYAAQARADAAKKPVSDDMKLHQMLIRLRQNLPSVARPPKRRGQPQNPAAAAPGGGKAQGLPRAPHSSAAQNTLPGGLEPARNAGAAMQAAATPATQNVWRSSAHLPGRRRAVRDDVMPSVAPIGPANGLKARAAVRAGRSFPQFVPA